LNGEAATALVRGIEEIRKRRGVTGRALRLRRSKRRQCLRRDHPRRDGRAKALAEERAERLGLPSLDVARGPVVEQAEAGEVTGRLRDGNRLPQRVARTDPDAKLELIIEAARGAEARHRFACGFALAVRAPDVAVRGDDR